MSRSAYDRFEQAYVPEPNSGCWIWLGCVQSEKEPYGKMRANGKNTLAHRYSWMAHKGEIPDGLFVCHKCDNPSCVNPDHLFLGTNLDNVVDRDRKGRVSQGLRHPNAKLSPAQVRDIYLDNSPTRDLATKYGVDCRAISLIRQGATWKPVTRPLEAMRKDKP